MLRNNRSVHVARTLWSSKFANKPAVHFRRSFCISPALYAKETPSLVWESVDRPVRNVSIIAHVDHGKTTLADRLLEASGAKELAERALDSNDLEKERGITILSKVTGFDWEGLHFNLVDTPGHADFGGEVERVLSMVDCALLVVDAREGPMAQTRYVLRKALKRGLQPVVVFNKADREDSRIGEVETEVFDLFAALDADEDQLDFPIVYASARDGWSTLDPSLEDRSGGMKPLLDTLAERCPQPHVLVGETSLRMLVTQIDVDPFVGKIARGRVASGSVRVGDAVVLLDREGNEKERGKVTRVAARSGLAALEIEQGIAGDIVEIAGISAARPTDTICSVEAVNKGAMPSDPIDPPTLSMVFGVNDSPLAGKEGYEET